MTRVPNVGVGREDSTFNDHGPGPTALSEPTCLARPWAAAWELYVAHASTRGYAAHLVPRPCAEKLSGSCLPAACAE